MKVRTQIPPEIADVTFRDEIVVIRVSEFSEESAKEFSEQMREACASSQSVIPIIIDSYGGQIDALMSMCSDIRYADRPVATIAVGKAMSCGAVLLTCGTRGFRYSDPMTRIMVHEASSGDYGKTSDVTVSTEELQRMNTQLMEMMSRNCGKKVDYFEKQLQKIKNVDWFMSPEEAFKHGMIEHLHVPRIQRTVKLEYFFG